MLKFLDEAEHLKLFTGTEEDRKRAFAEFFRNPYWIFAAQKHLAKLGAQPEEAMMAFHDAVLAFDRNVRRKDFNEKSKARTYFFTILKRCFWKLRDKQRSKVHLVEQSEDSIISRVEKEATVEELYIREESHLLLCQAINACGQPCKRILQLHRNNFSNEEIAAILGIASADSVKTQLYRCRKKIVQYFADNPGLR